MDSYKLGYKMGYLQKQAQNPFHNFSGTPVADAVIEGVKGVAGGVKEGALVLRDFIRAKYRKATAPTMKPFIAPDDVSKAPGNIRHA
jgi:hypothetical protein